MPGLTRSTLCAFLTLATLLSACGRPEQPEPEEPLPPFSFYGARDSAPAAPPQVPQVSKAPDAARGPDPLRPPFTPASEVLPSAPSPEGTWPADALFRAWPDEVFEWHKATSPRGGEAVVYGPANTDFDLIWISCAAPGQLLFDFQHPRFRPHRAYDVRIRMGKTTLASDGRSGDHEYMDGAVFVTFALAGARPFDREAAAGPFMIAVRPSGSSRRWSAIEAPMLPAELQALIASCKPPTPESPVA